MSTLATLEDKFNSEVKINKNDRVWNSANKAQLINSATIQLQKDNGFSWRENTADSNSITIVSGTQEYDLPSDFIMSTLVRYGTQPLKKTEKRAIDISQQASSSGTPSYYYIRGTKIGLHPIPSQGGTLTLDYQKRLPTITSSQDSSFPEDFDDAVIKYAAYLAFSNYRPKYQDADRKLNDYRFALNTLLSAYGLYDMADLNFGYQRVDMSHFNTINGVNNNLYL